VFDEIPHSEKVLKRHQNSDDPCMMAWDHYSFDLELSLKDLEQDMMCFEQEGRVKGFTTLIYPNMCITLIYP
jgi:hypothetical protein